MARLSLQEAIQRIKEPKNAREIREAREKRLRHQLHTESEMSNIAQTQASSTFLSWVKGLLSNPENFDRFKSLYRHPIATTKLTKEIFDEFRKVFDAQNAHESYEFTDPALENDMQAYLKRIGDPQFWPTQGFSTFQNDIDNVLVVDLPQFNPNRDPAIVADARPQPYYYILDLDCLIDIENTSVIGVEHGTDKSFTYFKTEYVAFRNAKDANTVYVFDDDFYRVFRMVDNTPVPMVEAPHYLGFCPARSFWTDPLNSKTTFQKENVITKILSDLDWWLFFSIAARYLKLYAPFPIYAVYKGRCDYKEESGSKRKCVDGYLESDGSRAIGSARTKCPKCSNRIKVGPGNVMEFKAPGDGDQPDLMANPMKVIPAEVTSLDFVNKEIKELRDEMFLACVGRSKESINQAAKNEDQVASGFESAQAVLMSVKRNFEIIKEFAVDTVARLRYGSAYLGCSISLGDEFFKTTEKLETTSYNEAKSAGLPEYSLAVRREGIDNAKYANNNKVRERLRIMRSLMPFPDQTPKELAEIRQKTPEAVPLLKYILKLNFNEYIDRFEREQANLTLFGSKLEFGSKIAQIRSVLTGYAQEDLTAGSADAPKPVPTPTPGPGPNPDDINDEPEPAE